MRACPKCGFENPAKVKFCCECGSALETISAPRQPSPAAATPEVTLADEPVPAHTVSQVVSPLSPSGTLVDADSTGTSGAALVFAGKNQQYEIIEEIGHGGMAVVYRARDSKLNREVALKRLLPEFAQREKAVARLMTEARSTANLQHPNIVSVYDIDQDAEGPYIAMEFVVGRDGKPQTLEQKVEQDGVLGERRGVEMVLKLCGAVASAHSKKIIHRDIKPSNILLTGDGTPKLLDFGIAHAAGDTVGQAFSGLTMEGATLGTLDYMAPEQEKTARSADERSDIYALGGVLYFCLTGQPGRHFRESTVPAGLRGVLAKALEHDLGKRFRRVEDFAEALRLAATGLDEELDWNKARTAGTATALNEHLSKWPKSESATKAKELLARIQDDEAWQTAQKQDDLQSYANYLSVWAKGQHIREAQARFERCRRARRWRSGLLLAVPALVVVLAVASALWKQQAAKNRHLAVVEALRSAAKDRPFTNSLVMKFVPVPGTPVLFSIWETRVQDYEAFVRETGQSWSRPTFAQDSTHPAVNVSWEDGRSFCEWLTARERRAGLLSDRQSYRLPMDEEWSRAVGLPQEEGGTPAERSMGLQGVYPWGTRWPPPGGTGNYSPSLGVDDYQFTSPVGSFAANQFGLFDLGGNASEWCEDWFHKETKHRTLRGASWNESNKVGLLSSYRVGNAPNRREASSGFRLVLVGAAEAD